MTLAGLALMAGAAQAADDGIRARIETWSSYAVAGHACEEIGYRVHPETLDSVGADVTAEAAKHGMSEGEVTALIYQANGRNNALIEAELAKVTDVFTNATGDEEARVAQMQAAITAYVARADQRCAAAARDPLFSRFMEAPAPAVLAASKRDFMDKYLEPVGGASWQTARMRAQANLLYTVGACSPRLTAAQLAGYKAGILDGPESADPAKARVRRYYGANYEAGRSRAEDLDLDAERCSEVLAEDVARLKATP